MTGCAGRRKVGKRYLAYIFCYLHGCQLDAQPSPGLCCVLSLLPLQPLSAHFTLRTPSPSRLTSYRLTASSGYLALLRTTKKISPTGAISHLTTPGPTTSTTSNISLVSLHKTIDHRYQLYLIPKIASICYTTVFYARSARLRLLYLCFIPTIPRLLTSYFAW